MSRLVKPLSLEVPEVKVRWVSKKYGNFVYNKVYKAVARSRGIVKPYVYTDFKITDEDGDLYTLDERDKGSKYFIIGG